MELTSPLLPQMLDIWQQTIAWQPTDEQQRQFQRLYELILAGNRQLNLTRITAPVEFWEKHLWDSLRPIIPLLAQESALQIIDVGTGAGFPGVPAAIAFTHHVTLLDSTRKKVTFLDSLLIELGIQNATTLIGRAEVVHKLPQYRQTYDLALVRAVGAAELCAAYTLPFLKLNGLAILYRGTWTDTDTKALQTSVSQLGGVLEQVDAFTTPITHSVRHCLHLRRI